MPWQVDRKVLERLTGRLDEKTERPSCERQTSFSNSLSRRSRIVERYKYSPALSIAPLLPADLSLFLLASSVVSSRRFRL